MYLEHQDWFLNCVAVLETGLEPRALLDALQSIEADLGRTRKIRYGPRTLDLDILFYGQSVVSEPGVEIPHPKMAERMFVLAPLAEILPDMVHPVLKVTVRTLRGRAGVDKRVIRRPGVAVDLVR